MALHHDHTDTCGCVGLVEATVAARSLAIPCGTVGLDQHVVYLNPAFEALIGVDHATAVHHRLGVTGFLAAAAPEVSGLLERALDSTQPPLELTWRSPLGQAVAIQLTANVAYSSDGRPLGYLVMARDVTGDRVPAEQPSPQSADFELVCQNLPDIVVRYDTDARTTYTNRPAPVTGSPAVGDVVGRTPLEAGQRGVKGIERFESELRRALASGEPSAVEMTFVGIEGDRRVLVADTDVSDRSGPAGPMGR